MITTEDVLEMIQDAGYPCDISMKDNMNNVRFSFRTGDDLSAVGYSKLKSISLELDISEFCGLTIRDLDMENRIINIDHQLQRTSKMKYVIEKTKTTAGTRKIPMTDGVYYCFQAILEDRETPSVEKMVGGLSGFLYLDKDGMPEVAMHWEHRFRHMEERYNEIYRVQMPPISPHVCRHTYCSNQARAGMNPKTLQYLMGHSEIGVTLNTYTHLGLEDAAAEMARMEEMEAARREQEKISGTKEKKETVKRRMFKVV